MKTNSFLASLVAIIGLAITTAAMIIEPTGQIDTSVITTLSICLVYSAALLGITLVLPDKIIKQTKTTAKTENHATNTTKNCRNGKPNIRSPVT